MINLKIYNHENKIIHSLDFLTEEDAKEYFEFEKEINHTLSGKLFTIEDDKFIKEI